MNTFTCAQRSEEWFQLHIGRVTASYMSDVMDFRKTGDKGAGSKRISYMGKKIAETLTGEMGTSIPPTFAMQWGTDHEDEARRAYVVSAGNFVDQIGFGIHPEIERFGASPDGLIDADGMLEIKCPDTSTHIRWMLEGEVPVEHRPQMYAQMAVFGRKWCDFISRDVRLVPRHQTFIKRLTREDAMIRMVTNLPPRVPATVYEASWFNNCVTLGYSGAYTATNIWTYYSPMISNAKVYAWWQTSFWTNEQAGFIYNGYQTDTNLATTWDAICTNPICDFLSGKINTAQYKAQALMNTNTGPLLYSLDGVHFYGAAKTNIWNAEINYLNQSIWTMTSYGYLPASTMYDGTSGGSYLGNYNGTFTGNGAGLTNLPVSGVGTNALALPLSGAMAANQSNAWVSLSGLTNIAQINFTAGVYTNLYFAGCSNLQAGFSFSVWLTQSSSQPTNLVAFNTNFWQPQVFGQILTMPTNSTSSGMLLSCFATATNTVKFTQTIFP